ncbi:MAG: flagellar hook-length control protein FliK [Sterolibacterium sp.]
MIPSDVASRLQLPADATLTRAPNTQQVSEVLSDLVPGQRVLAAIQSMLPNGAYRALINQHDVILALPFSAKAGDSLELEVVENGGKLALALVSHNAKGAEGAAAGERPAVETTLSRTGNFIAGLLAKSDDGQPAKPAQLNANQPISLAPPSKGADLVPLLKQAITQSGMFYESHQSQWVGSRLPTDALLSQPQGRLSPGLREAMTAENGSNVNTPHSNAVTVLASKVERLAGGQEQQAQSATPNTAQASLLRSAATGQLVAPDLMPLVQQQLEALASQTYVWQGQAWPGQTMQWEIIEENGGKKGGSDENGQPPWQTRLILTMPQLGEVRAGLRIVAGEMTLSLSTQSNEAAMQLANGGDALRNQLEAAGLKLSGFTVGRHERPKE